MMENLLSNAWKYTGKTDAARIELGMRREKDGSASFFVKDNGAGFDPRYAKDLFTPFRRLHNPSDFPGHGVGLATVQRIVHRHGGRIWAEAKEGAGATFTFTFPVPEPAS
jgi:signal transduction histidine kinase